jgi:hypothetical protein
MGGPFRRWYKLTFVGMVPISLQNEAVFGKLEGSAGFLSGLCLWLLSFRQF